MNSGIGYYICDFDAFDDSRPMTGVDKKVRSQIATMHSYGIDCRFIAGVKSSSVLRRGLGSLPGVSDGVRWPNSSDLENPSFLYIRKPFFFSREFVSFIKEAKEAYPDLKIFLEFPTYPYDKEFKGLSVKFAKLKDKKYREKMLDYVDYAIDFANNPSILGLPTLSMMNGIDMRSTTPRRPSYSPDDMNIVFAANFSPWHGADRLLYGLSEYRQAGGARTITIHLAGGGSEITRLKTLTKELDLEDVVFYDSLYPNELDELFDCCTLGVDCLGLHRRDGVGTWSSSLKSREYLAKGIPSIYAGRLDVFERYPARFSMQVPSDESPIDFNKLIAFYDKLYSGTKEEKLIAEIREYGEKYVDFRKTMANVLEHLPVDK